MDFYFYSSPIDVVFFEKCECMMMWRIAQIWSITTRAGKITVCIHGLIMDEGKQKVTQLIIVDAEWVMFYLMYSLLVYVDGVLCARLSRGR